MLNIMCGKLIRREMIERGWLPLVSGLKMAEDALFNLEAALCARDIAYIASRRLPLSHPQPIHDGKPPGRRIDTGLAGRHAEMARLLGARANWKRISAASLQLRPSAVWGWRRRRRYAGI